MRVKLDNRRESIVDTILWPPENPKRVHITAGVDRFGQVKECFIRGRKAGSEMDALMDDIAVVISRLLQYGDSLEAIGAGLCGRGTDGEPASLIGAVIDRLKSIEEEIGGNGATIALGQRN